MELGLAGGPTSIMQMRMKRTSKMRAELEDGNKLESRIFYKAKPSCQPDSLTPSLLHERETNFYII